MSAMLAQSPNPVLRRKNSDTDNKGTVPETATCDWPAVIYKLVEQFGMDSDPFKRHYVRELYSAGFDEIAKQVRIFVSAVQLLQSWKNSQQFSRKENLSRVRKEFDLNYLLGKFFHGKLVLFKTWHVIVWTKEIVKEYLSGSAVEWWARWTCNSTN